MNSRAPVDQERYEPIRLLGRGGAGSVYLVHDRLTGERVALKRLIRADTPSLLRLKREFRTLAEVHHPNLVKLYELGHDSTSAFFTMEYLEGEELRDYLTRDQQAANDNLGERLPRVLPVFQQLAHAVCALHQAGVLHRDLKPSNVVVVDRRVVLLDARNRNKPLFACSDLENRQRGERRQRAQSGAQSGGTAPLRRCC